LGISTHHYCIVVGKFCLSAHSQLEHRFAASAYILITARTFALIWLPTLYAFPLIM